MILHLLDRSEWNAFVRTGVHRPPSLETEGFVHCTGDDHLMLDVANRFYLGLPDPVVITIDESLLSSTTKWEPPAPVPEGWNGTPLFPHVYGPLELSAVTRVRGLHRDPDDRFVGYDVDASNRPTA